LSLGAKPYLQQISLRKDVEIDFEIYPFNIPTVKTLETLKFHPDVTFFVGENGSGKSTMLEAIAMALGYGPEGGNKNTQFKTTESISSLHESLRMARGFKKPRDEYFLRAESFFNLATYMDEISREEVGYLEGFGGKSLHHRSHGEAFMSLLTQKFRGKGLYLLDEPEAALSPSRQLAALSAIHQLVQDDSQFIIATHSPILLSYPNAKILQFDGEGISEVRFEDTDHFVVTKDFMNHYPARLDRLLRDDVE
jgi:predicted ATPase